MHETALDCLLGAALLPGVPRELAARGLQGALRVYEQAGDRVRAGQIARDLATVYRGTAEAKAAVDWLDADSERDQSTTK